MSDLIEHLKTEAARNQRLAEKADTTKRRRVHAQRAKHLQRAVDEIEQQSKFIDRLLNCIAAFSPVARKQWDDERQKLQTKDTNNG